MEDGSQEASQSCWKPGALFDSLGASETLVPKGRINKVWEN